MSCSGWSAVLGNDTDGGTPDGYFTKKGGGRVAALEVLIVTGAISNLIREGKTFQIPSMMQVGRAQGMIALNDALGDLVKKGLITADEAMTRSVDKGGMSALLKRGQPGAATA